MIDVVLVGDESNALQMALEPSAEAARIRVVGCFATAEAAIGADPWSETTVLICGVHLNEVSGVDLIRHVRKVAPLVKSLVYTFDDDRAVISAALRAGASGYLLKNCTSMDMVASIRAVASGSSPMSPNVVKYLLEKFLESPAGDEVGVLSSRETSIIRALSQGLLYKEIAENLGISPHTVHGHIKKIYHKLQAKDRAHALQRAQMLGYLCD